MRVEGLRESLVTRFCDGLDGTRGADCARGPCTYVVALSVCVCRRGLFLLLCLARPEGCAG